MVLLGAAVGDNVVMEGALLGTEVGSGAPLPVIKTKNNIDKINIMLIVPLLFCS